MQLEVQIMKRIGKYVEKILKLSFNFKLSYMSKVSKWNNRQTRDEEMLLLCIFLIDILDLLEENIKWPAQNVICFAITTNQTPLSLM